jgi:glycerophosphoryl diester phosphodiesterase
MGPGEAAMLIALLSGPPVGQTVLIIGHRGASADAPENTLASVKLALTQGVDGVEVDIHLSKDGRVMVLHDPDTRRTTGQAGVVAEMEAAALRALDAGSAKGQAFAGERLPFLEEVLAALPAGKRILVEIKCGAEILPALERILKDSGKLNQVTLMGFDREVVAAAKQRLSAVPVLWLVKSADQKAGPWPPYPENTVELARAKKLDGLGLHFGGVDQQMIEKARAAGMTLAVWTVDDPAEARRLLALGIDLLITNRPGWMRGELGLTVR